MWPPGTFSTIKTMFFGFFKLSKLLMPLLADKSRHVLFNIREMPLAFARDVRSVLLVGRHVSADALAFADRRRVEVVFLFLVALRFLLGFRQVAFQLRKFEFHLGLFFGDRIVH